MGNRTFKAELYGQIARIGKALASGHRFEILDLLAQSPRTVESLANEMGLSMGNTSAHLQALKEAHLVESQVGVGGGYRLSRSSTLITAGEVIRALDGRIAPMGCVSSYAYVPCEFEPACGLRTLWARTRAAMLSVLDQTTIADLCRPPAGGAVVPMTAITKGS